MWSAKVGVPSGRRLAGSEATATARTGGGRLLLRGMGADEGDVESQRAGRSLQDKGKGAAGGVLVSVVDVVFQDACMTF